MHRRVAKRSRCCHLMHCRTDIWSYGTHRELFWPAWFPMESSHFEIKKLVQHIVKNVSISALPCVDLSAASQDPVYSCSYAVNFTAASHHPAPAIHWFREDLHPLWLNILSTFSFNFYTFKPAISISLYLVLHDLFWDCLAHQAGQPPASCYYFNWKFSK